MIDKDVSLPGILQVNSDIVVHRLELRDGGKISGPNTLTVTGYLDWRGGSMEGTGAIRLDAGAILFVNEDVNNKSIRERMLDNRGRVAWSVNVGIFVTGGAASNSSRDLRNSSQAFNASNYVEAETRAGNDYVRRIASLRGDPANPAAGSLLNAEGSANRAYQQEEVWLSGAYADEVAAAETAYDGAIGAAGEDLDGLTAAEEARDAAIQAAGERY